jgi:CRISPR-associated protein Cas2
MFVVITYDVAADRTQVYRKLLVRYLTHEQNSVFAGDLTESSWRKLKADISKKSVPEDRLLVFKAENRHNMTAMTLAKSAGNGALIEKSMLHHSSGSLIL